MFQFRRRGIRLALVDLADEVRVRFGDAAVAGIQVLLNNDSKNFDEDGEGNNLEDAGVPVKVLPRNPGGDGSSSGSSGDGYLFHHKFMITDAELEIEGPGPLEGVESGRVRTVWTGSYNWTDEANDEYDELLVCTLDSYVFAKFREEFEDLWDMARAR